MSFLQWLNEITARISLAFLITLFAMAGITALGISIILSTDGNVSTRAQLVFSAVLPLFGTWVGTILAYYFAKENLESATNSTVKLAGVSSKEKLQSTAVVSAMVPKNQMFFKDDLTAKLIDILSELDAKEIRRLPVLDKTGHPLYLFYRDGISDYAYQAKANLTAEERNKLTLQDLLTDKPECKRPFATVAEGDTLAKAKDAMDSIQNCRDVFVTKNGTASDVVIGLITIVDIAKYAQV